MTNTEALEIINTYNLRESPEITCAVDLCKIDVHEYGVDEWVTWGAEDAVVIFSQIAEETLDDIMEQIIARNAGERLIDEMLGAQQTERINYMKALGGMRDGVVKLFGSLLTYIEILERIKKDYYDRL